LGGGVLVANDPGPASRSGHEERVMRLQVAIDLPFRNRFPDRAHAAECELPEPAPVRGAKLPQEILELELGVRRNEPGGSPARAGTAGSRFHEADALAARQERLRTHQTHHSAADDDD